MTILWVIVAACVTVLCVWAYFTAQRLDRLHTRLDRSRDALQGALDRRCAVTAALMPELRSVARETEEVRLRARDITSRLDMERDLAERVAAQLECYGDGHDADQARRELRDAHTRVLLALRFYNEAVSDTRALRLRPVVRALRLGGTAALPEYAALKELEIR